QEFKGIPGSVPAWAALRPSSVESRFEALHAGALTELVGREEELDLLLRRWAKAKTGEGQVVLLSGEPGIGKSRLTAALMEHVSGEPHTRLRYFCQTARCIQSLARWSARLGLLTTTAFKRNSTKSMRYWRRVQRRHRTQRC